MASHNIQPLIPLPHEPYRILLALPLPSKTSLLHRQRMHETKRRRSYSLPKEMAV